MSVLLVGVGPMGVAYARVLNALGIDYVAIGRGQASAQFFENESGRKAITGGLIDYLASTQSEIPKTAILALPIPELASSAITLMQHGVKKMLVEKPAGLTLADIRSVLKNAHQTDAEVYVGYNRRFYSSVRAARRVISEDGGATSVQFEFTEVADRILSPDKDPRVLENWFMANSSHVIDLAFFLGGEPVSFFSTVSGALNWHSSGAVFAGCGRTESGALYSYHADWSSAGRWGVDVCTPKRRVILRPLEQLQVQTLGSFKVEAVEIDDKLDKEFKPGLFLQIKSFLSGNTDLPTIKQHARAAEIILAMRDGKSLSGVE